MQDTGISEAARFMTDFWEFIKKHWNTTDWHVLVEESSALGEKHNDPLAHKLILAFLDYIEEKQGNEQSKKERGSTQGTQCTAPGANGAGVPAEKGR